MKSLLVTGAAGFIGSNFVRYLVRQRPEVHVVSYDSLTYAGNLENLADVISHPAHRFEKGDICNAEKVRDALDAYAVDTIVHFAAESHVDRSILGADVFVRTNIVGTQVLLDESLRAGITRFIHVSTDEVYGELGPTGSFSESTPLNPNSPYAASKAGSDLLALAYNRTHGLPVIVTRCSNNYGPFQFPEKLIPLMILNALQDKPLPVYGDGLNVRDWIHVDDHSRAIDSVLKAGCPGEVYNIGGNNEWRNIDIVKTILQKVGKGEDLITFVKDRPGHDRRYAIDASKIRGELGWSPLVSFDEGLESTVRWYQENERWRSHVISGEYQNYYKVMYENR